MKRCSSRLDLLQVSTERLLLVLALRSGAVRTIFVEVPTELAPDTVAKGDRRPQTSGSPVSR